MLREFIKQFVVMIIWAIIITVAFAALASAFIWAANHHPIVLVPTAIVIAIAFCAYEQTKWKMKQK